MSTLKTPATQMTLFNGLCPVRLPLSWTQPAENIRWFAQSGVQFVDFRANGGPALAFSVRSSKPYAGADHTQSIVDPAYKVLSHPDAIQGWTDAANGARHVEPAQTAALFGTSAKFIDLCPPDALAPGEPLEYPPEELAGYRMDTSTPYHYGWTGDSFGGAGFAWKIARTAEGGVVERYLGMGDRGWALNTWCRDFAARVEQIKGSPAKSFVWMDTIQDVLGAIQRRGTNTSRADNQTMRLAWRNYVVVKPHTPEGMEAYFGDVIDGVAWMVYTRGISRLEIARRQVGEYEYVSPFDQLKVLQGEAKAAAVQKTQPWYVESWKECYLVRAEIGADGEVTLIEPLKIGDLVASNAPLCQDVHREYERYHKLCQEDLAQLEAAAAANS